MTYVYLLSNKLPFYSSPQVKLVLHKLLNGHCTKREFCLMSSSLQSPLVNLFKNDCHANIYTPQHLSQINKSDCPLILWPLKCYRRPLVSCCSIYWRPPLETMDCCVKESTSSDHRFVRSLHYFLLKIVFDKFVLKSKGFLQLYCASLFFMIKP